MKVAMVVWDLAHMELYLSEHVIALAVPPLPWPASLHILAGQPAPRLQK